MTMLLFVTCFSSCRKEAAVTLDYSKAWMYAQSRTLNFQLVINSAEETDANVFHTVLTQISGTAALEYKKEHCVFTVNSLKVKITAGEVDFAYDSSVKYSDERDILRNTPFHILLDKGLVFSFTENGRISDIEGYEAITDALDQQAGRSETAYQIKRTFYEYFSEDSIKFLLERFTGQIPFFPIAANSTINVVSENVLPYGCNLDTVFQYNGITDNSHSFDITGTVSANQEYSGIKFALSGETSGKMELYESSGSGSPFRKGYEQSNLKGTEKYEDGGETIERNLSLTLSLQYELRND